MIIIIEQTAIIFVGIVEHDQQKKTRVCIYICIYIYMNVTKKSTTLWYIYIYSICIYIITQYILYISAMISQYKFWSKPQQMPSGLQAQAFCSHSQFGAMGHGPLTSILIDPLKIGIYLYKMVMINDLNGFVKLLEDYQHAWCSTLTHKPSYAIKLNSRKTSDSWGGVFLQKDHFFLPLVLKSTGDVDVSKKLKGQRNFRRPSDKAASGEFPCIYRVPSKKPQISHLSPGTVEKKNWIPMWSLANWAPGLPLQLAHPTGHLPLPRTMGTQWRNEIPENNHEKQTNKSWIQCSHDLCMEKLRLCDQIW